MAYSSCIVSTAGRPRGQSCTTLFTVRAVKDVAVNADVARRGGVDFAAAPPLQPPPPSRAKEPRPASAASHCRRGVQGAPILMEHQRRQPSLAAAARKRSIAIIRMSSVSLAADVEAGDYEEHALTRQSHAGAMKSA